MVRWLSVVAGVLVCAVCTSSAVARPSLERVAHGDARQGTLILYGEALDPVPPSYWMNLFVRTAGGKIRSLRKLQQRLRGDFHGTHKNNNLYEPPAFTRDGRWIAHISKNRELVARRIDLDRQRPLGRPRMLVRFSHRDELLSIAWSPGGGLLALAGRLRGVTGVWTVRRDGTHLRQVLCICDPRLAASPSGEVYDIAWAPGPHLGLLIQETHGVFAYSLRSDGSNLRRITDADVSETPHCSSGEQRKNREPFDPEWSPDGKWLALERACALFALNAQTGRFKTLQPFAWGAAWSPSGATLAFIQDYDVVKSKPTSGGRARRVATSNELDDLDIYDLVWLRRPAPQFGQ